jgi:hypothetical protein
MVTVDVIYLSGYAAAVKLRCERDTSKCVEVPVRDSGATTKRIGEQQTRNNPQDTSRRNKREEERETNKPSAPTFTRLKLV